MKLRQAGGRAVLFATGALVVAAVAACGGGQAAAGSASSAAAAPGPAPSLSPAETTAKGQPAKAPHGGGACKAADLSAALGAQKKVPVNVQGQLGAAGTHYSVDLVWTNHSGAACTMEGYGGVDMVGPDQGADGGPTFSLPRRGDNPAAVKLAAGATAHTTIAYIDPSGAQPDSQAGHQWTPTRLSVTPPNETAHLSVPWTFGPVLPDKESGIAAASISPVVAGS